ncbi:MAG: tRNA (adenosine(37)-N6)-threonylcarbamoyltransferase complex ATPase subunit type 1 TsaE [Dictyoglomaceae bacterium]|nr:tRNA (adenosine(37)-N6)-threonylcarbamoyltransferase complex ATPase subunit type 1 TsaE [Dictyoglomaceae bacterium]
MIIFSNSSLETMELGRKIGEKAIPGDFYTLIGDLGTGKTTFLKGFAKGLGINSIITSPSFLIIKEYRGKYPFIHIDAYRLRSYIELLNLGWEEYLNGENIIAVEWGERIKELWPDEYLKISFFHKSLNSRELHLEPKGERFNTLIKSL